MSDDDDRQVPKNSAIANTESDSLHEVHEVEIDGENCVQQAHLTSGKSRRDQWLSENQEAINAYNEHVDAYGIFSDGLRTF
jgi:antitoxin CcdA